jgi:ribonuclease VapC
MASFAVDTSVLVAVLNAEPEFRRFEDALAGGDWIIGWPNMLELSIWKLRNPGYDGIGLIDMILGDPQLEFAVFDREMEALAAQAYARFGKGRHPAKLNYGDCMAYAVAKHFDLPLLFKGADFALTDVKVHAASAVTQDGPQ